MDYLKIADTANKCEVKRQQISEYYSLVGGSPDFTEETKTTIYTKIDALKQDLFRLEKRLQKFII